MQADDLVLYGESEDGLKAMVRRFVFVFKRRGLKVNADKNKVMLLNEEEGFEYEILVNGMRLEHVSEFKYLRCACVF